MGQKEKFIHNSIVNTYSTQALPINKEDALRFIKLLTGDENSINHFTALKKGADEKSIVRTFMGTLEKYWSQLLALNKEGFNIFMAVNECGRTRSTKDVKKVRALFYDNDSQKTIEPPLTPSFRVISGRGDHGYWEFDDDFPVCEFKKMQSTIAKKLGTDPTITDPARLMRVPGFAHMKDPNDPRPVRLVDVTNRKYSVAEIKAAFPADNIEIDKAGLPLEAIQSIARKKLARLIKKAHIEEGAANPNGGRNKTALVLVREGFALGLPKAVIFAEMIKYCQASGLQETEVEPMIERQNIQHKETPFVPYLTKDETKKLPTSVMTEMFLNHEGLQQNHIRYWRGEFYVYNGNKYVPHKLTDLKPKIVSFFNNTQSLKEKYKPSWVDDIVTHLTGPGHLSPDVMIGTDIHEPDVQKHLVFLSNCVLQLQPHEKWNVETLLHDPRYFSQVALPYSYNPEAQCPLFMKVLGEILPDTDVRDFLQEWYGYNLIHDTSLAKFLVLLGGGANGKSVLLTVLTALLGRENISAVPLENFTATRTFPIAATIGKLANIVDEMGPLRGVEATLKQFVSGSIMNVERKGKDGIEQKPTARLTFATNALPTFHDRTDGLWRRMIVIPMRAKFLDESKRDTNFSRLEYWEKSDELPGILNWSIKGLQRLMARGHFIEPKCAVDLKKDFRQESDHISSFVEESLTEDPKGQIGSTFLYSVYSGYCKLNGFIAIPPAAFASAIRQAFPNAVKSTHPKTIDRQRRERVWTGFSCIEKGGAR